ncbi:MAG: energy transducer TonB [Gammaproteobacteria bacterium]
MDRNGGVTHPKVEKSSNPQFNAAALQAISQWKFYPRRIHGEAVRTCGVTQSVLFGPKH